MKLLRHHRSRLGVIIGAALVLVLAACGATSGSAPAAAPVADPDDGGGPAWQAVVDAANREGTLVLYTNSDAVGDEFAAAFNRSYPDVRLVVTHYASGELTTKLDAEKGARTAGADVAMLSSKLWLDDNAGRLVAPTGPALAKYWGGSRFVYQGGRFVLVAATPLGAGVNSAMVQQLGAAPIRTYQDLLQPQLKDALGILPGKPTPAGIQWWYYAARQLGGDAGVAQLAGLNPRIYTGTAPMGTDIASGEIAVGVYQVKPIIDALAAKGAPVSFVPLTPAISTAVDSAVVDWATHPHAAQVFQNWLLSPAGQVALAGNGGLLSALDPATIPGAPATMTRIPADGAVADGILTPEQSTWLEKVWSIQMKLP
ncbi:hypothetical protein GCM10009836_16680 [Pseudonocardia ailaonensis]|uniref:ABC transporter substrate-binding protein n=1 Tax=Pseudonocardia ailaonensis TaxID=367279 RepID=A0ABN2MV31_9PSEU